MKPVHALLSLTLTLTLAAGCNSGKGSVDGDGNDGIDDGGGSPDGQAPWVAEGTITCFPGSDSSGDIFYIELEADDPQGSYTLASIGGRFSGYEVGGAEVFTDEGLVCEGGQCEATFRDGHYGAITCATHEDYTFTAAVIDQDGNWSEEFDLEWEG